MPPFEAVARLMLKQFTFESVCGIVEAVGIDNLFSRYSWYKFMNAIAAAVEDTFNVDLINNIDSVKDALSDSSTRDLVFLTTDSA
jgi:hypothetical protein